MIGFNESYGITKQNISIPNINGMVNEGTIDERVGIFLDVENVIKTFRGAFPEIKHAYVDFRELRIQLAGDRCVICSNAYSAYNPELGVSPCLRRVEEDGFQLMLEEQTGFSQKGVDIRLALDIMDFAKNTPCDTVLLVSGDADFVPAVKKIKSIGKKVQIASFEDALGNRLASAADEVILLDELEIIDTCRLRNDLYWREFT